MQESPVIQFKNVDFSYGDSKILSDISFEVGTEETLVVLGGSGSGKSTLLRLLLGLIEPDSGKIYLEGRDLTSYSEKEMVEARKRVGMVFQEGALFDSLTVGENVGYFLFEHRKEMGLNDELIEEMVREVLRLCKLEHTIDMMPHELSGGMKRRVAAARTLVYKPHVVLYDEPTTGLDPATCETLCDIVNDIKADRHVSGILVTHNMDDAWRVGDRFLLLRDGRIEWIGSHAEMKAKPKDFLDKFFHGEPLAV